MSIELAILTKAMKFGLGQVKTYIRKKKLNRAAAVSADDYIVVVEVGRPVADDVITQLGDIDASISYPQAVQMHELNKIAAEIYTSVAAINRVAKGKRIIIVLTGPVALNAILGQFIGLGHFNVVFAQWQSGAYVLVPSADRSFLS